jgi:hypothetical protein
MENSRVEREYLDEELRRLATEPGFRPAGWDDVDVRGFRRLVQCACAAHVEDDLWNMRLLRIEPDGSGDPTRARATLSSGREIDLTFKNTDSHGVVALGLLPPGMETPR